MIRNPGPMLHKAMNGSSKSKPWIGGRFMGRKNNRSAYCRVPRNMKKIEVEGMMLVMKISVREMRLFLSRALVKIAARIRATIISRGTVSRK